MSLGARIIIALFTILFGIMMFLHGSTAEPTKAWFSYAFAAFCIFIAAATILKGRAAQFFGSIVGTSVFLIGLLYLGDELFTGSLTSGSRSRPSIINACMFLFFFGVPGILYTVKAKFGFGEVASQHDFDPDESPSNGSTNQFRS